MAPWITAALQFDIAQAALTADGTANWNEGVKLSMAAPADTRWEITDDAPLTFTLSNPGDAQIQVRLNVGGGTILCYIASGVTKTITVSPSNPENYTVWNTPNFDNVTTLEFYVDPTVTTGSFIIDDIMIGTPEEEVVVNAEFTPITFEDCVVGDAGASAYLTKELEIALKAVQR